MGSWQSLRYLALLSVDNWVAKLGVGLDDGTLLTLYIVIVRLRCALVPICYNSHRLISEGCVSACLSFLVESRFFFVLDYLNALVSGRGSRCEQIVCVSAQCRLMHAKFRHFYTL